MHFLQDPLKAYIFYPIRFFYVLPKKYKSMMATHDYYFMFKTFFSQGNNKGFFGDPFKGRKTQDFFNFDLKTKRIK